MTNLNNLELFQNKKEKKVISYNTCKDLKFLKNTLVLKLGLDLLWNFMVNCQLGRPKRKPFKVHGVLNSFETYSTSKTLIEDLS